MHDFNYSFLNESISWLFEQEKKTAWLMNVAMSITILFPVWDCLVLACLPQKEAQKKLVSEKCWEQAWLNIAAMLK